jgi:hypothetical protein
MRETQLVNPLDRIWRILVIDGGGAKGPIAATVLLEIFRQTGIPPHEMFDLIWGTSVGALIGGILATGQLSVPAFYELFLQTLPEVFTPRVRVPILQPKYTREAVDHMLSEHIGKGYRMRQCRTKFCCTSVDVTDSSNHYFKGWEDKDGELTLRDAMSRSYAAPLYFGEIVDKPNVWVDGGTGNMNCPIIEARIEAFRQGWLPFQRVHMLSVGCGESPGKVPFKKASRYLNLRQVLFYLSPSNGGLARKQCNKTYTELMEIEDLYSSVFSFQRLDAYDLDPKINIMDGVKYIPQYIEIGQKLAEQVDYTHLR